MSRIPDGAQKKPIALVSPSDEARLPVASASPSAETRLPAVSTRPGVPPARQPKSRLLLGLRLYWILVSASVRAKMQYKFDFVSTTMLQGLTGLYDYFLVAVMLWRFKSIQGWDIWEIGLLYAVSRIGWGLYRTVGEELDKFEGYIVRGDFDSVLLRPWPSLFVLVSRNFDLTKLGWILQGLAVGIVSAARLSVDGRLTGGGIIQLILACIWSGGLYWAVGVATASAAFKIVRIEELQVFTENATGTATLYPLEIYPNWLRYFLLTAIPLGAGNYIPVRYILGKGGTVWNLIIPPLVTALCIWVSNLMWHAGERSYHSTGS